MTFVAAAQFWRLPAPEKILWMEAWAELLRAAIIIRVRRTELMVAENRPPKTSLEPPSARRIQELMLSASSHHLKTMSCLERSVGLQRMLLRHGIEARLKVGVKNNPTFEAHAWVEADGLKPDGLSSEFTALGHQTELCRESRFGRP